MAHVSNPAVRDRSSADRPPETRCRPPPSPGPATDHSRVQVAPSSEGVYRAPGTLGSGRSPAPLVACPLYGPVSRSLTLSRVHPQLHRWRPIPARHPVVSTAPDCPAAAVCCPAPASTGPVLPSSRPTVLPIASATPPRPRHPGKYVQLAETVFARVHGDQSRGLAIVFHACHLRGSQPLPGGE